MNKKKALISGQIKKYVFWLMLLLIYAFVFMLSTHLANFFTVDRALVEAIGLAFFVASIAGASLTIKCPFCGLKLFLYAAKNKGAGEWFAWLINVDKCPKCHKSYPSVEDGKK